MLSLLPTLEARFTCPGEVHPISRAVHLSRLAAFYPKCRECAHRHETGQLPHTFPESEVIGGNGEPERSLFTLEGVRGVYLNELTRVKAARFASAFASVLWDSVPLTGCLDSREGTARRIPRRSGPVVVVGFDERFSSPDLVTGIAAALRRMSCQVVDIGQTTAPCFRFAVAHLSAAGGVMVTGSGCGQSWTGLDFTGKWGRPVSASARRSIDTVAETELPRAVTLEAINKRMNSGTARPLRQAGTQRVFQASVPYLAGLWKHFHALRPLNVAIGCASRIARETLTSLFEKLPVTLHWVDVPQRARDLTRSDDEDVERVRAAVKSLAADIGFLIDDDAARATVFDETGAQVPADELLCLVAEVLMDEQPGGAVVVETAARERLQPRLAERGIRCWLGGWTASEIWQALRNEAATCGGGQQPRLWLRDTWPAADAVLTLAKVLQCLSRDDAPLSEVRRTAMAAAEWPSEPEFSKSAEVARPA